jgi:hypothetical protein
MAYGAVAGTNTQKGSSPTYPLRIDMTKDEKVGQIYVLCLLESAVQISPAPPKTPFAKITDFDDLFRKIFLNSHASPVFFVMPFY